MTLLLEDIDLLSPAEHAAVDAYRDAGPDERRLIARLALAEEATRAQIKTGPGGRSLLPFSTALQENLTMKKFQDNCFTTFPRARRDNPLRDPGVISGPYTSPGRSFLRRRVVEAAYWAASIAVLLSMFAMPELWARFAS